LLALLPAGRFRLWRNVSLAFARLGFKGVPSAKAARIALQRFDNIRPKTEMRSGIMMRAAQSRFEKQSTRNQKNQTGGSHHCHPLFTVPFAARNAGNRRSRRPVHAACALSRGCARIGTNLIAADFL
jgi:hypothetical protein